MHPSAIAQKTPNKPAYIIAETGQTVSFKELDDLSMQGSQLFRHLGLNRGDHVAILLENHVSFLQICLAAQRSGLYFTTISYRLQEEEVDYIANDCQANSLPPGVRLGSSKNFRKNWTISTSATCLMV